MDILPASSVVAWSAEDPSGFSACFYGQSTGKAPANFCTRVGVEPASVWSNCLRAMPANAKSSLPAKGKTDAQNEKKDPEKKEKILSPAQIVQMEKKKQRDALRINKYLSTKEEERLRIGMSICEATLRAKGFEVKQEEDKTEKFESDLEHVKKVTFREFPYPSGSASEPARSVTGSVSSHYPVRGIMRKFTRKTITKAIKKLEEKVQIEENRKKVNVVFKRLYARNDPATRRAKAALQKIMGKEFQPVLRREEKLGFLIQPRAASRRLNMCRAVSSRAQAMLQEAQKS